VQRGPWSCSIRWASPPRSWNAATRVPATPHTSTVPWEARG
jgi:hypothetical protein